MSVGVDEDRARPEDELLRRILAGELDERAPEAARLLRERPDLAAQLAHLRQVSAGLDALGAEGQGLLAESRGAASEADRALVRASHARASRAPNRPRRAPRRAWLAVLLPAAVLALLLGGLFLWPERRADAPLRLGAGPVERVEREGERVRLVFAAQPPPGGEYRVSLADPASTDLAPTTSSAAVWDLPPEWTALLRRRGALRLRIETLDAMGDPVGSAHALELSSSP